MQHSVEALTDMTLCVFPREKLWSLYRDYPTLAFDITWLAAREEQILDDHLLSVGRRTSIERIAYLLLHLFERAEQAGLCKDNAAQFPFTQQHLADTLGMSLVHTNKTLKRLMATKTVRWKDRRFELLDRAGLTQIAGIEPPQPRAQAAVHLSAVHSASAASTMSNLMVRSGLAPLGIHARGEESHGRRANQMSRYRTGDRHRHRNRRGLVRSAFRISSAGCSVRIAKASTAGPRTQRGSAENGEPAA